MIKDKKKIQVGIVGGAGYGGSELLKLLLFHPQGDIAFVTSRRHAGKCVSSVNRFLSGLTNLVFIEPDMGKLPPDTDLVFFATPHGASMNLVPEVVRNLPHARIIDLSGDFRLKDPHVYRQFYKKEHQSTDFLDKFVKRKDLPDPG